MYYFPEDSQDNVSSFLNTEWYAVIIKCVTYQITCFYLLIKKLFLSNLHRNNQTILQHRDEQ